ncbi:MAG: hypothetical protein RJQ09_06460 [Cyclobacteriaceae bacterium]
MNSIPNFFSRSAILVSLIITFQACNLTTETYRFAYKDEGVNKQIMTEMKGILEDEFHNVVIDLKEVNQPIDELEELAKGGTDFLLIENYSTDSKANISTAFLAYPKFLHVFYRDVGAMPSNFGDLIAGKKIYLEHPNSAEMVILQDLAVFYRAGGSYELTADMAEADVVLDLSSFLTEDDLTNLSGFQLFSFDDVSKFGQGSQVEGISLKLHRLQPYIIPEGTYGNLTEKAKLTLELDMVMLANEDIGLIAVNDLIKTVLRHKQSFVSIDPILFIGLDEQFDRSRLSYPLHPGSRAYLDREEPGFFERYAELAGVILSILIASISGLISFKKYRKQHKKDLVDVFYRELMDIKNEPPKTIKGCVETIQRIKDSQNKAFDMLIDEKLAADESFRIYMELCKETITEIRLRMRALKSVSA